MRNTKPMTYPTLYYTHTDSPLGPLLLTSDGMALTGLFMTDHAHGPSLPCLSRQTALVV